jgi:hypothetical protein
MHSAWFSLDIRGGGGHWDRAENRVKASSLTTDNGVIVNELLRTKENAMGRLARRKTARKSEPYDHLPFFYSDMFDLGYEAVGEVDSHLETFADWKQPRSQCIAVECVGASRGRAEIDRVGRAFLLGELEREASGMKRDIPDSPVTTSYEHRHKY